MRKKIIPILCIICLICLQTSFCVAEGSTGYQQAYIAMLEEFDRGNYEDAYIAAKIVYEAAPGYQEIVNYYNYLTALQVYLPAERYKEAYDVFETLALQKFQKSEGYAAFARGCQNEKDGDYSAALEQFNTAFSNNISEAFSKIKDCKGKCSEEGYGLAESLVRQKNYLAAAEVYDALVDVYADAREKAKECYYLAAEQYSHEGKYTEAADLFTRIRDYKDSEQKAIQNRKWAEGEDESNKLGLCMEDASSTSISLKWEDETALGSFAVAYMPAGIESQIITESVNDTHITLEGLLPNTQYTVSVSSPSNPSFFEKNNYWTNQADLVTDYNIRRVTIIPRLLDRSSVRSLGVDALINTAGGTDKCIEMSEKGYQIPDRKPSETNYDTYVFVAFFADEFAVSQQAEMTYIIRLDGKTSAGKTESVQLPEKGYKIISANLTDLMDVLYENTGMSGSELIVDVYVNGQHMGTESITIGNNT